MMKMKKSLKDYIEIGLTIAIIVGLFLPYTFGVLPMDVMFDDYIDLMTVFMLTIPILVIIPLLIILIFKDVFKNSTLRILKTFFLMVYLIVLGVYFYSMYESFSDAFGDSLYFIITIVLSLLLLILTLKFSIHKSEQLHHIFLAILSLPIILYFIAFIIDDNFDYGGYIINISFTLLYILAIYTIYKNHHIKKLTKKISKAR